jgi:hypothetical protein
MSGDATLLDHAKHFLGRFGVGQAGSASTKLRRLGRVSRSSKPDYSARRLNSIASGLKDCENYLEVGVAQGLTLERVEVPFRWGVDPEPQFDTDSVPRGITFFKGTSDQFFQHINRDQSFDLVFLDGLHHWQQTYCDLLSTLNHTSDGALILIDDVVPDDELSAMTDYPAALAAKESAGIFDGRWHGDVFKVLMAISDHHPELKFLLMRNSGETSDNAQAVVWVASGKAKHYDLELVEALRNEYESVKFEDVFGASNSSRTFSILEEEVAIPLALEGVAKFRI